MRVAQGEKPALGTAALVASKVIAGPWTDAAWTWANKPSEWVAFRERGLI